MFSSDKIKHVQDCTGSCMFRHDQGRATRCTPNCLVMGWLAEGGFSVTNSGNLDRIRHDQGWGIIRDLGLKSRMTKLDEGLVLGGCPFRFHSLLLS